MKKTLTINLNGTVFNVDEDAYQLLDEYLKNLHVYFRKEEDSDEILADFEARIAELFNDRIRLGYTVISIEQVKEVIGKIGNPEDFGMSDTEENEVHSNEGSGDKKIKKKLYRDIDNKKFGGVCSGISNYFGWDSTPLRIIFFILIFASSLWIIPVYLILWLFIPAAKAAEQKLQMRGEEVTLENIGKTISDPPSSGKDSLGNSVISFIVGILKICLVGVGCLIGIPLIFTLFIILIVLFALLVGGGSTFIPFADIFGFDSQYLSVSNPIPAFISITLLVLIPLLSIVYGVVAHFGKLKPIPASVKWVGLLVWLIALFAFIFFGVKMTKDLGSNTANNRWKNIAWFVTANDEGKTMDTSGVLAEIDTILPVFKRIKLNETLFANVKLVQTEDKQPRILVNGDSNIIDEVDWNVSEDGTLNLSLKKDYRFIHESNLIIKIITPDIQGIENSSFSSVVAESPIKSDEFSVIIEGAGKFNADTLVVKKLKVDVSGIGSVSIAGKAQNTRLMLEGAGKIDALEFESDTVFATLEGVGSIKCNPQNRLDAKMEGVGKITYKSEPKSKDTNFEGLGKIGLE